MQTGVEITGVALIGSGTAHNKGHQASVERPEDGRSQDLPGGMEETVQMSGYPRNLCFDIMGY